MSFPFFSRIANKRMVAGKKLRMHKQASYDNAIGGSFEDEHPAPASSTASYSQPARMRKQV
jgi:hypothetical protein